VSTKVGVWKGGFDPHQPDQLGSSCHPGGPNLLAPMISAPKPTLWRSAKALSTPSDPPASAPLPAAPCSAQNRVANIHSCRRSPAWPKGASADCGSPVAKPSSEMARLWILVRDICAPPSLRPTR
jgi:hypothetical protein